MEPRKMNKDPKRLQAILDQARALPQKAKDLRKALLPQGWKEDDLRSDIFWLWDNGYISVSLEQIIIVNRSEFEDANKV
jgi:hypothetical protein